MCTHTLGPVRGRRQEGEKQEGCEPDQGGRQREMEGDGQGDGDGGTGKGTGGRCGHARRAGAGGDGQGDGAQTTARDRREREQAAAREAENCHQVETAMRGQEGEAGESARTRGSRAREQASAWQGQESATTDLTTQCPTATSHCEVAVGRHCTGEGMRRRRGDEDIRCTRQLAEPGTHPNRSDYTLAQPG